MSRPTRAAYAVHTADRADEVILDGMLAEAQALQQLDADLTEHYGVPGLVGDLWRAAYCRAPELLEAKELQPRAQINRTLVAAQLGSPEHTELRRTTTGDAFMATLAVVNQAAALRRMLRQLEDQREQAQQAQDKADAAAAAGAGAGGAGGSGAAEGGGTAEHGDSGVQHDQDGEGGQDGDGEEQRAPAEADAEAAAAEAQHAADDLEQALAAAPIRAAARQAAQSASEQLDEAAGRAAAWGLDGDLQRMSADERMQLATRLKSGRLAEWADLIGRFRQLARAQRARRVEHARGEYVGVTLGDDLGNLILAELAHLAVPALRAEFAARYAERRLMVYDQRGEDHEAQGAVIALIDCSMSMQDTFGFGFETPGPDRGITPEAYAKALALALLEQARACTPTRDFVAITFDEYVDAVFPFPGNQPVHHQARIDLAERFSGGGTNFMVPLEEARTLLAADYNTTGRQKADLVLITDGDALVTDDWVQQWWQAKRQMGFRCFGVEIGRGGSEAVAEICDDTRTITDLADPHATAGLFRSI